jgi:hypothetical protein
MANVRSRLVEMTEIVNGTIETSYCLSCLSEFHTDLQADSLECASVRRSANEDCTRTKILSRKLEEDLTIINF